MSRQALTQYTRLLARWPIDTLRPEERSFQRLLQSRITSLEQDPNSISPAYAERETHAANLLLENAFSKRFPPQAKLMQPASDPEHYERLTLELEEGPQRSWLGRQVKKLQGMVRWS